MAKGSSLMDQMQVGGPVMWVLLAGSILAVAIGIKEALTTTAAGLTVAIPAQWVYNLLSGRVADRIREIEVAAHSLLEIIES